jgi:hypothetical protein
MAYIKTTWENEPSESTPINASNLNKIEEGIYSNSLKADQVGDITNLNTTDKTSVVNAINSMQGTILWTNPNPTSSFAAQDITLNSDDYDVLEIIYMTFNTNNQTSSVKIPKGYSTRVTTSLSSGTVYTREYTYNSDTSYTIGSTSGGNAQNLYPLYIIGYKTGLFN